MNNPSLIFLIRRDHVFTFAAHLAAGILALVLLTGAARSDRPVSQTETPSSMSGHR